MPIYRADYPKWVNVKRLGATGDGATDDLAAINAAIARLNLLGSGALYFPASTAAYLVSDALTTITVPCLIFGDGQESGTGTVPSGPVSLIRSSHATASLFTIAAAPVQFSQLALDNSNANPTAGAAITTTGGTLARFELLSITDFFTGIDIENSNLWTMRDCYISGAAKYGVRIRNTANPDAGDWAMDGVTISNSDTGDAAIRIESSGGGKINNCKISSANSTTGYDYGIDVALATGVSTSVLLISNTSIEHVRTDGIRIVTAGTGSYDMISIVGCQFGLYANTTGAAVTISSATAGNIAEVTLNNLLCRATGGNTGAAIDLVSVDNVKVGLVTVNGFGSTVSKVTSTNVTTATPVNRPLVVIPDGLTLSSNKAPGADQSNATAQIGRASPIHVPAAMRLRSLWIAITTAAAGSIQWGLFDWSSSLTAAVLVATGSAAPGGTGWREIAATSAPIDVQPGTYMLIIMNPLTNPSTIRTSLNSDAAAGFWKAWATYTWDTTPDLTSGSWTDSSLFYQCYLEGDMDEANTRW